MAAWMPAVASDAPFPNADAFTVAHRLVRAGTPPRTPGFHVVRRSAGMMLEEVTSMEAVPIFDASATLVAPTWYVPTVAGAVYRPEESTVPPPSSCTDHVTAVDCPLPIPVTVAVNVTVPPGCADATLGETETAIGNGIGNGSTVTVAASFFEGFATLVATTWYVPAVAGAV